MYGKNERVARDHDDFKDGVAFSDMGLDVVFAGPFVGRPAVHLTLAHCNLNCTFCDVQFNRMVIYSPDDCASLVIKRLEAAATFIGCPVGLVVTGGEPSLQPRISTVLQIVQRNNQDGALCAFQQIETNGALSIDHLPPHAVLVCSPKCEQNGWGQPISYNKPLPAVLERAVALLFMIDGADTSSPYYDLPKWALEWRKVSRRPLYVAPIRTWLPAGELNAEAFHESINRARQLVFRTGAFLTGTDPK